MLWSFLFIISFGVCFGQHARYFQFKIEKNGNSGLIWRFEGIDNINKKPNSVDKSWSLTYITSDTFFVEVESLDKRIQSWQCGDRKLSTSDDCNGLNLYNVTHSCKEEDYLYSGILLEFGKTEAWTTIYTICCRKTDVTSGYKYIAVKKMLNHSEAQDYCSKNFTKFSANGTLCSFQSQSDWKNISDLIKTLECTGSNTLYWTGLKFNNKTDSYNFSDGTNATFATGLVINRDSKEKCVVANSSHLERSPCSKKAYFICKITMNNVSTPGNANVKPKQKLALPQAQEYCSKHNGILHDFRSNIGNHEDEDDEWYWAGLVYIKKIQQYEVSGVFLSKGVVIKGNQTDGKLCVMAEMEDDNEPPELRSSKCCAELVYVICKTPKDDGVAEAAGNAVNRIMVNIIVDKSGRLISGEKRNVVCSWKKVKHFTLSGHTNHVTIKAHKAGRGNGGILASFSNNLVTDESWQCADMDGCNSTDCESFAATEWANARAYGFNNEENGGKSREKINQIKSTAQWIWAKNEEAKSVWCRKRFAVTSSSQPSTQPSTTVQEPPRTSDSSANVATSSISSSTATSSTLAKTITLGTPETTVSEPIATITSTILQATTLITEETTMTTLKPITTAVLESTATIATATTTTVLESTATTPMTEGTTTATGATTTRTEGTKPLTSSPNIASSSDMTGLPTTFRTSIVNPTTTVSSVEPSSTTADNEFEKELNNVNVKKEGAMQKIIKITTDFINNEASKDTTDPAVLIAPLVENKLIEYGKANLDTRHNGLFWTKTEELEIRMRTVAHVKSSQQDITFPVPTKQNAETEDFIKVPLDPSLSNDSILVVIIYNVSPGSDSKESTQQKLISKLISVEIAPKPTEYSSNITFSLEHENYSRDKVYCAFINESKTKAVSDSPFSTQGCSKVKFSGTRTECTCNHLTSFAVIAKIDGKKIPVDAKHRQVLSIITYIGLTLSLIGETLTVASYVLLIGMNTEQAHLHTNLAFSLGLAQIFFLAGINCATSEIACLLVTAMIHYFYLVTFCWMLVEGFHLYLMVVKVFNEDSYLKLYYLFSWVTPLVIVSLALIAAAASPTGVYGYVSNEDICWISHENSYIWFFLGPVLLICLANLVLLILVVREMTRMNKTKGGGSLQFRKSVKACVLLFPILGTTWVFSVLLMLKYSLAVEYIFNILNSLQGFMIFLFYVMRSSEIRGVLQQRKARWANSLDLTNHVSTYQITRTTSDKSQPTSASSIKPILGSWFSPNPCAPSPITTRSSRSTPSPRGTPSPRDTPSPRGTPIPRATPNPRVSPSRFNTPSPFTSSDPPDLFENPRRPSRSITIDPEMETHYAETSA